MCGIRYLTYKIGKMEEFVSILVFFYTINFLSYFGTIFFYIIRSLVTKMCVMFILCFLVLIKILAQNVGMYRAVKLLLEITFSNFFLKKWNQPLHNGNIFVIQLK